MNSPTPLETPKFYARKPPQSVMIGSEFDPVTNKSIPQFWDINEWVNIPLDKYGVYSVEWLKWLGAKIIKSELVSEKHTSLCGKSRYTQRYRVDTYEKGARIPAAGGSNESRSTPDGCEQAWHPLTDTTD